MVTIFDVAAHAGVSKSTVSLVLNCSPLVKEETRQRVLKSIKTLNYVPNYYARSLIRPKNNSIGVIKISREMTALEHKYEWSNSSDYFSHDVEGGIIHAIVTRNLDLSVMQEGYDLSKNNRSIPRILEDRRVDGAILIGSFDNDDIAEAFKSLNIPIVLASSSAKVEGVDTVYHSSYVGSKMAFKKLVETGHKRICLVNCPKKYTWVWPERIRGVKDAAAECGFELDESLLISAQRNTSQSAYEVFNELIDTGIVPDAVLAANNEMVLGVMRSLYEHRLRVPDDISVICYEDSKSCGCFSPALSAVNVQKEKIGEIALSYLLDRIADPTLSARVTMVEPFLVMRQSVASR